MNCPGCGAENPDNSEYCSLCFHRFAPQADGVSGVPDPAAGPIPAGASPAYPEQAAAPVTPDTATPFTGAPAYDAPPPPPEWNPPSNPAQAYGAPPPPMPGVSPGGYQPPPSEWGARPYDPGSYGVPPPPPIAVAKKPGLQHTGIGTVLIVAITVLFFALGWFATDWYLTKREVAYVSAQTDISFRHPSGWKKINSSDVGALTGLLGTTSPYELVMIDAKNDNWKCEVLLGSLAATTDTWESTKANIDKPFGSGTSLSSPVGSISMSGVTVKDTSIAGSDAKDITFKVSARDEEMESRVTYIYHGARVYILVFLSRSGANGAQDQVQKILDSVQFKK